MAALLALAAFASAIDVSSVWNWLLKTKGLLTGPRFQALAVGVLLGILAERWKVEIGQAARSVGGAIIGEKDNSAWPLQGAVALIVIAGIVLAVRPDLLSYLRSFKLGTFEATFADRQPTTLREAHLNLRDFREQVALVQYQKFREKFLSKKGARGLARTLMMDLALRAETGEITADLISSVEPIIDALLCLQKANALRTAVRDYDLVAYAVIWEDFLLRLHDGKADVSKEGMTPFLNGLSSHARKVVENVNKLTAGCAEAETEVQKRFLDRLKESAGSPRLAVNPDDIVDHYSKAKNIMEAKGYGEPEIVALTVLEPYLTGVRWRT